MPQFSAPRQPAPRRLPSNGWSRLRAPQLDPLEAYGLASKGDTRLLDAKTQETYFRLIVSRYMAFCAATGGTDLEAAFKGMSLEAPTIPSRSAAAATTTGDATSRPATAPPTTKAAPTADPPSTAASATTKASTASTTPPTPDPELTLLLSALRKLREALIASRRNDPFAQRVYLFALRAALLMRSWEGYAPCLSALLNGSLPPLPPAELSEVVGLAVLDAACRLADLGRALGLRRHWRSRGVKVARDVDCAVQALLRDDWLAFWAVEQRVDGYARSLLGFAAPRIRLHVLKVVGRAYMRIEAATLEAWTGMGWAGLVAEGVGWEREGEWIVVRRAKK